MSYNWHTLSFLSYYLWLLAKMKNHELHVQRNADKMHHQLNPSRIFECWRQTPTTNAALSAEEYISKRFDRSNTVGIPCVWRSPTKNMCTHALSDATFSTNIFPSDNNSNNLHIAETTLNTAWLPTTAAQLQRKLDLENGLLSWRCFWCVAVVTTSCSRWFVFFVCLTC